MGVSVNLTHHFLIAMPTMADPHFANTLTYVCEHNPEGALGIVINKPIDMTLSALFEQINIPLGNAALRESPVHFGGPVQVDRGFVLHRPLGNWQSTLAISDEDYIPIYGGEAVISKGRVAGRLRSCAYGFTVKKNLAYTYLPINLKPGDEVEVDVFGELVPATVMPDALLAKEHAGQPAS